MTFTDPNPVFMVTTVLKSSFLLMQLLQLRRDCNNYSTAARLLREFRATFMRLIVDPRSCMWSNRSIIAIVTRAVF